MLKTILSLTESDLFTFLGLFDSTKITTLHLDLYNGTGSGHTELPNGGHVEHTRLSLYVQSIEALKAALDSVEHNQVQKCRVSLYGSTESVTLDLLKREMFVVGQFEMAELEKCIAFCREVGMYEIHMRLL